MESKDQCREVGGKEDAEKVRKWVVVVRDEAPGSRNGVVVGEVEGAERGR